MAISIQCANCGKKYQAADHMAGRRVRCKGCGVAFQLPLEPNSAEAFQPHLDVHIDPASASGSVLDNAFPEIRDDEPVVPAAPVMSVAPPRPTPEIPPPFGDEAFNAPFNAEPSADDVENVFQEAFVDYSPARGNTVFVFPGSHFLDRWLPTILVAGCVLWLIYLTVGSGSDEPPWVGAVRLMILLLTYAGVVFPLCLKGARMAAHKMRYDLPSGAPWRAFSTFLLPVTIGCALWLTSQTLAGFLFGAAMGLIVTLPIMWLLFRIRTDDAPTSLGYGAAAFGIAIVGSIVLLAVLNLVVVGVINATKAEHDLYVSPFGPSFHWPWLKPEPRTNLALEKAPPKPAAGEPVTPTTKAFSDAPPEPAGESVEVVETPDSPPVPPAPTDPVELGKIESQQAKPEPPVAKQPIATTGPIAKPPEYGVVVAEVFHRLALPAQSLVMPVLPGKAVAAVGASTRANEDRVELYSTGDWRSSKAVSFARAGGDENYQLSADGSMLARVADFPYPSAQVYSFERGELIRPFIKLDAAGAKPQVLGFLAPGQLMIFHSTPGRCGIDVWDVNRVQRVKRVETGNISTTPGGFAFSRDGKQLAAIVRDDAGAGGKLEVYSLATGKLARRIVIDELQWNAGVKPLGISFNEEGDKIAVLFEQQGQGLFLCWANDSSIPIHQFLYPGGLLPEGVDTAGFKGQAFDLVDDAEAWLLFGSSVFDTRTGKSIGNLGISNVKSQRVVSRDTVLLSQQGEGGAATLLEVRLDVKRARRDTIAKQ